MVDKEEQEKKEEQETKEEPAEVVEPAPGDSNNNEELKGKVVSGVFWRFLERFLAQGIGFVVSIFLARMLSVEDYGAVAIILIFVNIADVFLSSGFSIALIRKKKLEEKDLTSVFYLNLIISVVLYAIIFFTAPLVEKLFHVEGLTWLLRIIALKLPVSSLNTIQIAIVSSQLRFKMFFFATLGGTLASAVVGITMAYTGFGAWALVAQHLTNLVIDTIILFILLRWYPKWMFSKKSIKEMTPFSLRNMATDLTGTVFNYLNQFVVGIKYTAEDLGYYSKGQQLPQMINTTVSSTMNSVLFPAISKVSEDKEKVKRAVRKSVRTLSFILIPMMAGLAVVSKELVLFLYTDKWLDMVPFMQLVCISVIFDCIGAFDVTSLKAIGKAKATLILEFIKKPICLTMTIVSMFYGVLPIAIAATAYNFIALMINSAAVHKYIGYNFWEKIVDFSFPLLASIVMGGIVYCVKFIPIHNTAILFIKVGVGIIIYLAACLICRNKTFYELIDSVKKLLSKKKKVAQGVQQ